MFTKTLLLVAIILVSIDSIYLFLIKNYFANQVQIIQQTNMKLDFIGIIICYIFLVFGLYFFIIKNQRSTVDAFLLGIFVYGVFDLTNKAIFSKWSWQTVTIDTLWGGILFALTSSIVYKLKN